MGPRIAIIGNGGGGKSTLARALARSRGLPLHEVDDVQFGPAWERVDPERVSAHFDAVQSEPRWLIDGFGPWPLVERRAFLCDDFVLVDLPLAVHLWWAGKRQVNLLRGVSAVGGRSAPPSLMLLRATLFVHRELRPRLHALARRLPGRVHVLRSRANLRAFRERHATGGE